VVGGRWPGNVCGCGWVCGGSGGYYGDGLVRVGCLLLVFDCWGLRWGFGVGILRLGMLSHGAGVDRQLPERIFAALLMALWCSG
jgi:hypothetical protein